MTNDILSQNALILDHLKAGRPITPLQALKEFGCFRLGARIWELRREGHAIDRRLVLHPTTGKRFAEYRLARNAKRAA